MNVFVLSTGRCGSKTFAKACSHIENFSSSHESRIGRLEKRVKYPDNHIEVDNRLSWFLGRIDKKYGKDAFYVHQKRNRNDTAKSLSRGSYKRGIVQAYREKIIILGDDWSSVKVCKHFYDTVNSNIESFLKDKPNSIEFNIESAERDFREFWESIGAEGDLSSALHEWDRKYHASDSQELPDQTDDAPILPLRAFRKAVRIARKLPRFLKKA